MFLFFIFHVTIKLFSVKMFLLITFNIRTQLKNMTETFKTVQMRSTESSTLLETQV